MIEHMSWEAAETAGYATARRTLTIRRGRSEFHGDAAARKRAFPGAWEDRVGADPPFVGMGRTRTTAVTRAIGQLWLWAAGGESRSNRALRIDVDVR